MSRASKWPLLRIVNAIFYVCGEGIKWRALPGDFDVPWSTVYWYFSKWRAVGSWQALNDALVTERRLRGGAAALPTALVIDSQTVKNTATATRCVGVDGGKKTKGRKRLTITDGQGNLLATRVVEANRHDGAAAARWWAAILATWPLLCEVSVIYGDKHFGGRFKKTVEQGGGVRVRTPAEPVRKRTSHTKMTVHKNRWVVERTFAWTDNSRRLSKDYERLTEHSEAFMLISSSSRLIRNPIPLN